MFNSILKIIFYLVSRKRTFGNITTDNRFLKYSWEFFEKFLFSNCSKSENLWKYFEIFQNFGSISLKIFSFHHSSTKPLSSIIYYYYQRCHRIFHQREQSNWINTTKILDNTAKYWCYDYTWSIRAYVIFEKVNFVRKKICLQGNRLSRVDAKSDFM